MKRGIVKVNHLWYVIFIISWNIGDLFNNVNDDYKYIFFFFHLAYLFYYLMQHKKNNNIGVTLLRLLYFIVPLFVLSLCLQLYNHSFCFQTIKDFLYIFCPIIYVFMIANCEQDNTFDFYFNTEFIVASIVFILRALPVLSFSNIRSISFISSYSPFESIGNADIFFVLFFYYAIKKKRLCKYICFLFLVLSFKRLHLIYALALLILLPLVEKQKSKKTKNWIYNLTVMFFMISPFVINIIFNDSFSSWFYGKFGVDFDAFTMGRFTTLNYVIDSDRVNLGLGSISDFLANARLSNPFVADDLHNDIMRISLEGTIVSVWLLVVNYFGITKNNIYNFLFMLFAFLVMFSSHILTTIIFWIFGYLFIISNDSVSCEGEVI